MSWDDPALTGGGPPARSVTPARDSGDAPVELGHGGQGTVLRGRDRHLPRDVAWKVAGADHPEAEAMLAHEASVLAALEHPGIVPVYDLVKDLDGLRMAIRVVRGATLAERIAATPAADRLRLVRHVLHAAEAVAWAHSQGYVHRDLKPANIMIGELGETQVIDWGIAVHTGEEQIAGRVVGTPQAMSPEQARGERVGPASDVWSLGATLFHVVTGRPLYVASDGERVLSDVRQGRRARVRDVTKDLPRELCDIVDKALAPSVEARYPDARALSEDLLAWLDGRRVAAHHYGAWELVVRVARRFWLPLGVFGLALVAIAVLGVSDYLHIRDERDRAQIAEAAARAANAERERALATSSIAEARRELQAEQRVEARAAATRGLALREDPWARGVLAASGRSPEPRLVSRGPALRCLDVQVAPDGRLLCGTRDAIAVWDNDRLVWSLPLASRGVAWLGGGAMVVRQRLDFGYERLDATTGASLGDVPALCRIDPQAGAGRVGLSETRGSCVGVLTIDSAIAVRPCGDTQSVAVDRRGGWAALCRSGELVRGRGEAISARVATSLGTWLGQYNTLTVEGDTAFFGTTLGEVVVVDMRDGRVLARRTIASGTRIRGIDHDAASGRLVVRIEGAGPDVLDRESLVSYGRLAREEQGAAAWLADGRLATWSGSLALWELPHAAIDVIEGLVGVTGIDSASDSLVVTHESVVSLVAADSGRVLTRRSWQDVVAKAPIMTPEGDIMIGLAIGETHPLPGPDPADPGIFHFVRGTRRLVRVPGGRYIQATTGRTLAWLDGPLIDGDDVVIDAAGRDSMVDALLDGPFRGVAWYALDADATRVARCPVDAAVALSLGPSPGWPEVYLAEADGVVVRDATCAVVQIYATPEPNLTRVLVSPSGAWIAGGTRTGEVFIWSADGTLRARIQAHTMAVSALSFEPRERWLTSGAWDGRVRFYALDAL